MHLSLSRLQSPLGEMLLVIDAQHSIRALDFADHRAHLQRGLREHYGSATLTEAPAPQHIAPMNPATLLHPSRPKRFGPPAPFHRKNRSSCARTRA